MQYRVSETKYGYNVQVSYDGKKWVNKHYFSSKAEALGCVEAYNNGGYVVSYEGVHFFHGLNGY